MRRAAFLLFVTVGCGSSRATSDTMARPGPSANANAPAETKGPTEPAGRPTPASIGELTAKTITHPPTDLTDMIGTRSGVVMLVSHLGRGTAERGSPGDDGKWVFEPLGIGSSTLAGNLAAHRDDVYFTRMRVDTTALTFDLDVGLLAEPSRAETVLSGCSIAHGRHALVVTAAGPAIAHSCREGTSVTVRRGGQWREVRVLEKRVWIVGAAVDRAGAIHVLGSWSGHHVVTGDTVEQAALPDHHHGSQGLAACGGQLWGAFEIDSETGPASMWVGTLSSQGWTLEPVPSHYVGYATFAFDGACRPFVAIADEVFARGAEGWVGRRIPAQASVQGLVVHDSVLYAAYETYGDGVMVGVASAPILVAPP